MKKYILVFAIFAFVLGLFTINTNSAVAYEDNYGCMSGDLFSRMTGARCKTSVSPASCAKGDIYSSLTGEKCTTWQDNSGTSNTELKIGDRGEKVRAFQQLMKEKGFFYGNVDGKFGPITNEAAIRYYKKYPIKITPPEDCPLVMTSDGVITHMCPPPVINSNSVVISGVSGPQYLNVNQEGTWTVKAYDKNGGKLSYSVDWGDKDYALNSSASSNYRAYDQSATFTHSYARAGTYKPTFTVTSENTIRCITTPCPTNGGSAQTSLTVKVKDTTTNDECLGGPVGCVRLTSLSQTSGPAGTSVAIYGSGFTPTGNKVMFGKAGNVNDVGYSSSGNVIIFNVPSYSEDNGAPIEPGNYEVYVKNSLGTSLPLTFKVTGNVSTESPSISSLSPNSGVVEREVTIYGNGFTRTGNKIKFGDLGIENSPTYNLNSSDGKTLTFKVPVSNYYACWSTDPACYIPAKMTQPGEYQVSVINENGTSNSVGFTVTYPTR